MTAQAGVRPAPAEDTQNEQIEVTGKRRSAADTERARLREVPGGTSVVDQALVQKGRVFTSQDILAFQPGVYAQSSGGGDGLKISIRGSGLQTGTNYFRQGIYILFDGLPVTGPGGTPYELFEPLGLDYTAVLRGANAFNVGSVDLGGAIDYHTKTGYTSLPAEARYEFGSFGYQKEQLSSGKVVGALDYYVSLTNSYRTGYQDQTRATSTGVVANLGYQITPDISTRFYLRYRQTQNEYPGFLTSTQIAKDPTVAQAPYSQGYYGSNRIQPGSTWVGNKTSFRLDDRSKLDVGFVYHNYPIDIRSTNFDAVWGYDDVTASAQYTRRDDLFGHDSNTTIGFFSTTHVHGFQETRARILTGSLAKVPFGALLRRADYEGSDNNLHIGNDTNIWRGLWLTSGLSTLYARRAAYLTYPVQTGPSLYKESLDLAPRGGLRYVLTPHIQLYGNVSRTVEPPNDWEFLTGPTYASGPLTGLNASAKKLRNETALTWEIGTSGQAWNNEWSVSYYHSDVRNELLNVSTAASLATGAVTYGNASPTTHQGVETSLDTTLWRRGHTRLWLRQSYTFSQFNYKHDVQLGSNQLPGIPRHFYQGEIRLDLPGGFYGAFNAQVSSSIPIDYANTDYTRPYHIFGATIGYDDAPRGRQVFVNFQNIADKHYAAIVSPTLNDKGVPGAFLQPGDGFGVFGGVAFGFR
ncbi:TonB-dependent receptor family protein [Rhizosaccharibacter radicis]|uniref:TonB-dependent receptor n=1 Tax=Rhizosaccharibacter radicis TaxID=2782605 RepID=A0ABT1W0W0_9PROT|nr:TonB-dependent receptor [Acetobacteraceae bacterium KSS12]